MANAQTQGMSQPAIALIRGTTSKENAHAKGQINNSTDCFMERQSVHRLQFMTNEV